jgi:DNA/RNA endonuclease YhcR with UshA esterase domain
MNSPDSGGDGYPVGGPQVKHPFKIMVLRYASLVLAVAGLILLYLFAVTRDIPLVRIGDITPTMNFACVRMTGEVTHDAYVFESGGAVFNLKDGSGEIAVMGGRAQIEALEAAGKLPRRGDRVEAAGILSVSADQEPRLRLQSAGQLILHRKQRDAPDGASCLRLSDVTAARQGDLVNVTGTLKSIEIPGPGSKAPYLLILAENGSELAVVFRESVLRGLNRNLPVPGKTIYARGRVDIYKNTVQLKVGESGDLRVMAETGL